LPLIVFFGPDGGGKTTLALMLREYLLKTAKFGVMLSWIRGTHTLALVVANILSKFRSMKGCDNPYFNITIRKGKEAWQLIEFFSAIPLILFKFVIPSSLGFCVIGERCPIDSVVWVSSTTNDPKYMRSLLAKFLVSLILRESGAMFYVVADRRVLLRRRLDEKLNDLFLGRQLIQYESIYKMLVEYGGRSRVLKIDTSNRNATESFIDVMAFVKARGLCVGKVQYSL